MRYSTSSLLVAIALTAVVTWSGAPTNPAAIIRYIGIVVIVAACAALRFRHGRPYVLSIVSSVLFFFVSLVYWWVGLWIGYFADRPELHPPPYFEDGMMAVGIIYPFVYFGVYSPMIAAIALFVSVPTVALANLYGDRPAASKS